MKLRTKLISNLTMMSLLLSFTVSAAEIAETKQTEGRYTYIQKQAKKIKKRKPGFLSKTTHKRLERALHLSKYENYDEAQGVLVRLLKRLKNRKSEAAQVWQHLGFTMAQKGDLKLAAKALENSLELNALSGQKTQSSLYTLAQLYAGEERFVEALDAMKAWQALAKKVPAQADVLMATILSSLEQKEEALGYINSAINKETTPKEQWLQFALSLNHELKHYKNSLKILAILTSIYPKKDKYWKQFASTYLSLQEDAKALAMMELAHELGYIQTKAEYLNMASVYLLQKIPYKAAKLIVEGIEKGVLEKNVKNLNLLTTSWFQAKEKTEGMKALKQVATLSKESKFFARLGYLHLEDEAFKPAITSFSSALKKDKIKDADKIYFARAIAKYNLEDIGGALSDLSKAKTINPENESVKAWIDQIRSQASEGLVTTL